MPVPNSLVDGAVYAFKFRDKHSMVNVSGNFRNPTQRFQVSPFGNVGSFTYCRTEAIPTAVDAYVDMCEFDTVLDHSDILFKGIFSTVAVEGLRYLIATSITYPKCKLGAVSQEAAWRTVQLMGLRAFPCGRVLHFGTKPRFDHINLSLSMVGASKDVYCSTGVSVVTGGVGQVVVQGCFSDFWDVLTDFVPQESAAPFMIARFRASVMTDDEIVRINNLIGQHCCGPIKSSLV
jgi:hypothetical protein